MYQVLNNFPPTLAQAGQVCRAPYSPEGIEERMIETKRGLQIDHRLYNTQPRLEASLPLYMAERKHTH